MICYFIYFIRYTRINTASNTYFVAIYVIIFFTVIESRLEKPTLPYCQLDSGQLLIF